MLKLGSQTIQSVYVGSTAIASVYIGNVIVHSSSGSGSGGASLTVTVEQMVHQYLEGTYTDTGATKNGYPVYTSTNGYSLYLNQFVIGYKWCFVSTTNLPSSTSPFGDSYDTSETGENGHSTGIPVTDALWDFGIVITDNSGGGSSGGTSSDTITCDGPAAAAITGTYTLQSGNANDTTGIWQNTNGMYLYYSSNYSRWYISGTINPTEDPGEVSATISPTGGIYPNQWDHVQDNTYTFTFTYSGGSSGGSGSNSLPTTPISNDKVTINASGPDSVYNGNYVLVDGSTNDTTAVFYNSTNSRWIFYADGYWRLDSDNTSPYEFTFSISARPIDWTSITDTQNRLSGLFVAENSGGSDYMVSGVTQMFMNARYVNSGNTNNGQPIYTHADGASYSLWLYKYRVGPMAETVSYAWVISESSIITSTEGLGIPYSNSPLYWGDVSNASDPPSSASMWRDSGWTEYSGIAVSPAT